MLVEEVFNAGVSYFHEKGLREKIVEKCQVQMVPADTMILSEGAYVKVVPIVLSGLVKVFKQVDEKEILLYYIQPSESCIMSISSSFKNEKSQVKAITEEDSELLLLPSQYIGDWQKLYPSMNQFIIDLYKKRFEDVLNAFNAVAFQKMDERIMDYLTNKSQSLSARKLTVTHQKIADDLGIARETVSRLLKKLEHDQRLSLSRGSITLLNL